MKKDPIKTQSTELSLRDLFIEDLNRITGGVNPNIGSPTSAEVSEESGCAPISIPEVTPGRLPSGNHFPTTADGK